MHRLSKEEFEGHIRAAGLKLTPQRRAVVSYLAEVRHHPSAEEVLMAVNRQTPAASRATVYNTLRFLKGAGLLVEFQEGGRIRFDPHLAPHHHFVCRQCGAVADVGFESVNRVLPPESLRPAVVESYQVTFRGTCARCGNRTNTSRRNHEGQ